MTRALPPVRRGYRAMRISHEVLTKLLVWLQAPGRIWDPSTSLRAGRTTVMPYFHFCLSCRERLFSTSRMTIDHRCPQCGGRLMPYHLVRAPGPTRRKRGGSYPSLADFYNGDDRRLASSERDVGLWWRD